MNTSIDKSLRSFLHHHSFSVGVFFSIVVFVLASSGLVVANGESIRPDDSHIINLRIDGQEKVIPTRASNVAEVLEKQSIRLSENDTVEPSTTTPIDSDNFQIIVNRAKPLTIIEGETSRSLLSPHVDNRKAVTSAGFELSPEDDVVEQFSSDFFSTKILGRTLTIVRAKDVTINLYGTSFQKKTKLTTVDELLKSLSISPALDDTVSPAREAQISDGLTIFIAKFGKQLVSTDEVIAFTTEFTDDANLSSGAQKIIQAGKNGRKVVTYELELKNGLEIGRRVIQETIAEEAVVQKSVRGTKPLFADYNAEGIPARVFCGSPKQGNWKNINVGNAAAGRSLAAERGWTGAEFDALLELFACESSWNERAGNPVSGAYGIPQSWPASKMSSFGDDYMTNPITQLRWGLNYVASRYGTPSAALAFHYRTNYY